MNRRAVKTTDKEYFAGDPYSKLCAVQKTKCYVLFNLIVCHAECDAILSKGTPPVKGCTLYITKYPCNDCAKVIIQSGIKRVVCAEVELFGQPKKSNDLKTEENKKHNSYLASKKILNRCLNFKEKEKKSETSNTRKKHKPKKQSKSANGKTKSTSKQLTTTTTQSQPMWYE